LPDIQQIYTANRNTISFLPHLVEDNLGITLQIRGGFALGGRVGGALGGAAQLAVVVAQLAIVAALGKKKLIV
jgi:hypothetical protein